MESLDSAINELIQARIDALLLQVASFPDGEMPIYLAERLSVPIIVHSIPEPDLSKQVDLNSLCGANMICATLTAFNHAYRHIHGDPTNSASAAEITLLMNAATAVTTIKQVRIGLIGFRAPGFYPCVFDEVQLRKKMGLPVDHIGLNELERELHTGKRRKAPRDTFPVITGGVLPCTRLDPTGGWNTSGTGRRRQFRSDDGDST
jgi:L-fucose isomerase-like protein